MIYTENIKKLRLSMQFKEEKKTGKHTINEFAPFLPFKTRNPERPKFRRKFVGVTGEVARLINSKKLVKDFNIERYIDNIINEVECKHEEDKKYLRELISDYLIDKGGDIKVFHANIFNYLQFTDDKEGVGEKDIAKFLYDVLFLNNDEIKKIFEDTDNKNMITKLILNKLSGLEKQSSDVKYENKLKFITKIATEDFNFMLKNKEFFLKNFPNLLAYYYFYYITQFSIKINKKFSTEVDYNKPEEIYYLLDWERASKNRRSDIKGYRYIKEESKNLLININLVEHLNALFNVRGYALVEIKKMFDEASDVEKLNYLETIQQWIKEYRTNFSLDEIETPLEFESLINCLINSLSEKIEQATMSRYALSIEEIGKRYFLKRRGSAYGYMLNLTQEMVLLLTAISIKEEKITLKSLFTEYERRGVYLDQYSKELVIELLVKLNLVDKKSDSGDAQYVKTIL